MVWALAACLAGGVAQQEGSATTLQGLATGKLKGHLCCCRNPACNDLCSKCYRERAVEQERMAASSKTAAAALNASRMDIGKPDSPVLPAPIAAALEHQSVPEPIKADTQVAVPDKPAAAVSSSAAEDEVEKQAKKQKNPGRCACCSKKIGLATGFTCRCELRFCATHRYSSTPRVILGPGASFAS